MRHIALTALLTAGLAFSASAETLVTVNGKKIQSEQVDFHVNQIPQQLRAQQDETQIRQNILERLVEQELVRQDAAKKRVSRNKEFSQQFEQMRRNLVYNYMVNQQLEGVITLERLQAEYQALAPQITQPAVNARHILVETEGEARDIIKKLNNGADFSELAAENSLDNGAAQTGGSLGWFGRNDMVPAFAEAAFSMEAGSMSKEPVQTPFGWHVIKVEDTNNAYVPPFEQVAPAIQQRLTEQLIQAYLAGLRENAKVKYSKNAQPAAAAQN